jgi:DNA polymerase III epsilon subunit-like protein
MVMVFDVETNGLFGEDSVLSFSCVILNDDMEIVEEIDRYYYAEERYNSKAIRVNGLTIDVLKEKRKGVRYPRFFKNDRVIKRLFIDNNIDLFIAHNIDFDVAFVENNFNIEICEEKCYCTMREVQFLYNAPYVHSVTGEPKFPKLVEALEWGEIDTKKIHEKTGKWFHDSLFDVYCTLELYKKLEKIEKD